jgi:hypothetical protein
MMALGGLRPGEQWAKTESLGKLLGEADGTKLMAGVRFYRDLHQNAGIYLCA